MDFVAHRTKTYFQRAVGQWDALYSHENRVKYWFNRVVRKDLFQRYRLTFENCGEISGSTVLDLGCGTGRYSVEFARRGARRVVGIDFASSMVEFSRRAAREAVVERQCEFVCVDCLSFQFNDSFDIVVAMGFFDYIPDPLPIFEKVSKLTGRCFLASFPSSSYLWDWQRHVRYAWIKKCPVYYYSEEQLAKLYGSFFKASKLLPMGHSYFAVGFNP